MLNIFVNLIYLQEILNTTHCVFADPIHAIDSLPFGNNTFHFITTHSHALDQQILQKIYTKSCCWLGMIGSKTKRAKFLMRFKAAGIHTKAFEHLHTPAGIEIGAETPAEIAISILAQIIKTNKNRTKN